VYHWERGAGVAVERKRGAVARRQGSWLSSGEREGNRLFLVFLMGRGKEEKKNPPCDLGWKKKR